MYQSYPLAWLSLVTGAVTLSVTGMASLCGQQPLQERLPSDSEIVLAESHLVALNRRRRIIVNYDIHSFHPDIDRWVECRFGHADQHGSQIDTMFFCIDGGNLAHYPSKVIPLAEHAHVRRWLAEGIDCVKVAVDAAHERHLEAFYTYRVNGSDRLSDGTPARIPLKDAHPEWLLDGVWWEPGFWDFTVPEVRAHKLAIVRELVENYDLDGLELDFCRTPPFVPIHEGWQHRGALTEFVESVRRMLLGRGAQRGRPCLLSVRVPATVPGCHHDGLDVESWVGRNLVDMLVLGTHSIDVDLAGFRAITARTHVKLYPCMDDAAHAPSGYHHPGIEVERGIFANWWHQGADGVATFNWANTADSDCVGYNPRAPSHQVAYREIGDPRTLYRKNKRFVIPRRFGGGWGGGDTPWLIYANVNLHAPLPLPLPSGSTPRLLTLYVSDDVAGDAVTTRLRLLLTGIGDNQMVQVKVNGVLLGPAQVEAGHWRIYEVDPASVTIGANNLHVRVAGGVAGAVVEKLELDVRYGP